MGQDCGRRRSHFTRYPRLTVSPGSSQNITRGSDIVKSNRCRRLNNIINTALQPTWSGNAFGDRFKIIASVRLVSPGPPEPTTRRLTDPDERNRGRSRPGPSGFLERTRSPRIGTFTPTVRPQSSASLSTQAKVGRPRSAVRISRGCCRSYGILDPAMGSLTQRRSCSSNPQNYHGDKRPLSCL